MNRYALAVALVLELAPLPSFSQYAKMELPESLNNDVTILYRRRMRTPGQPVEFPPYQMRDLKMA